MTECGMIETTLITDDKMHDKMTVYSLHNQNTKPSISFNYDPKHALKLAGKLAQSVESFLDSKVADSNIKLQKMIDNLTEYNKYMIDEIINRKSNE